MTTPSGREEPEDLPFHTTDDFDPLNLPNSHHLVITTPRLVNIWDINGTREIFRSGSSGIVASRRSKDGSGLLAVADSQVVILHDVRKGRQRSYRLKGKEVKRIFVACSWTIQLNLIVSSRGKSVYLSSRTIQEFFSSPLPCRIQSNRTP